MGDRFGVGEAFRGGLARPRAELGRTNGIESPLEVQRELCCDLVLSPREGDAEVFADRPG